MRTAAAEEAQKAAEAAQEAIAASVERAAELEAANSRLEKHVQVKPYNTLMDHVHRTTELFEEVHDVDLEQKQQ